MGGSNIPQIRALQALSTFFTVENAPTPGATYPYVTYRTLARFLDCDATILKRTLAPLAEQGFCEVTQSAARLTPSRWALNQSRYSSFLSFYVARAPVTLRGEFSQLPIDPRRCINYQPQLEGKNCTIADPFNGVYSSSKYRELCEPRTDQGPYELIPPLHPLSKPELSAADNLDFLVTVNGLLFRAFLASLWLQGYQTVTPYGPATVFLAEFVEDYPCLVAAPCDGLFLGFLQLPAVWSPQAFIAPFAGEPLDFSQPTGFPHVFKNLLGGSITLEANGVATITAPGQTLTSWYEVVGPALGGSFLVSLVPCAAPVLPPVAGFT